MRRRGAVLFGATRHELTMQVRRPAVWVVMGLVVGLPYVAIEPSHPLKMLPILSSRSLMGYWAMEFNLLSPIAFALLLAGRVPRDRHLHTGELLDATPTSLTTRLWAMYLGGVLATALPIAAGMVAATTYEAVARRDLMVVPDGVLALMAVNLPGLLLIGAFSIIGSGLVWTPLYWILFIGYWIWGNLLNPTLAPTLSGTLLTPIGNNAASGIFGTDDHFFTGSIDQPPFLYPTLGDAVVSIVLLVTAALVTMLVGGRLLTWLHDRSSFAR
jgi:hypothetical protein